MLCNYTIFPSWFCDRFICLGQVNGATIYSVYDRSGALVTRDDVTTGETTEYVAGPNGTFAKYDGSVVTYLHNDIVGSAVSGTNSAGNVTWRQKHTPFGEELNAVAANKDEIGFTGHIKDSDTGLNYMQARFYDPVIGRFYSNDPVGWTPTSPIHSFGRYTYANNNPYKYTDPNGEFAFWGAAFAAALDVVTQGVMIATGHQESFDPGSVMVSAAAGFVGVGIANQVSKLGKAAQLVGNVTADASISAGSTALKGGDVTLTGVAIDVVAGQTAGKAAGNYASNSVANSAGQKLNEKAANRLQRIANKPDARNAQVNRANAAQQALQDAPIEAGAAASVAGSNSASSTVKTICNANGGDC